MSLSAQDIVIAAIAIMALVGVAILFGAWRHAVRIERTNTRDDDTAAIAH
jgi:hypothetical protein